MAPLVEDNTQQDILNKLLVESCDIYTHINALYLKLESNISAPGQQISTIVNQVNTSQITAKNIDDSIKQALEKIPRLTDENTKLFGDRERLLKDSLLRNKAISQKASTIKSHVQHEVNSLHTNRNAINGYRGPEVKSRSLINNRF